MQSNDADILFSGSLLGLDEPCGSVDTDDQASGDFGIEGTAVASLFNSDTQD